MTEGLRRSPGQSRSQEKVDRIVKAAESLLREVGYASATDSPGLLIDSAGVTKGTFYTYFENPESVMHHLAVQMLDRACRLADDLLGENFGSLDQALGGLIDRYADFYRDRAVQEIWLYHRYNPEAEALDASANSYIMTQMETVFDRIAPAERSWPAVASAVTGQFLDHLMQHAFRVDPDGDPEILAETKRLAQLYVGATWPAPAVGP
jgi:AcrR family transcriptional regulator